MKKIGSTLAKTSVPLIISAVILYFTYRNYDFTAFWSDMKRIDWRWLALALSFSAAGPFFRGIRWNLLLEPIGYNVPRKDTVLTVFTGYAANIIIPRVGEISRCGILENCAKVPFSKSLGTLVAERFVDAILLGLIVLTTVLTNIPAFVKLFTPDDAVAASAVDGTPLLQNPRFYIAVIAAIAIMTVLFIIGRRMGLKEKLKSFINGFIDGFMALRKVRNLPLFMFYSLAIWACYYLELYLAFYCMPSTSQAGMTAGLVCFAASSVAVLVPTPNGAGPWNLAIVKMLGIYGVPETDAQPFSFVLHLSQTLIYLLCGLFAWVALRIIHRNDSTAAVRTDK